MKRVYLADLALFSLVFACWQAACVPATDEPKPLGAAGFALRPNEAVAQKQFRTADGYVVHIERLLIVLRAQGSYASGSQGSSEGLGYSDEDFVVNAAVPSEVFARKVELGFRRLQLRFSELSLFYPVPLTLGSGVTETDLARLRTVPDVQTTFTGSTRYNGACLWLKGYGERADGRRYRFDWTFAEPFDSFPNFGVKGGIVERVARVDVVANELRTAPATVRVEAFFSPTGQARDATFDGIARADVDGNGVIDASELEASVASKTELSADEAAYLRPETSRDEAAALPEMSRLMSSRAARNLLDY
jgi:hypothetical protein